jgi:myb proto-oncogene protein
LLAAAANFSNLMNIPWDNAIKAQVDATKLQLLHNILQVLGNSPPPNMEALNNLFASRDHQLYEYLRMNSQLEGLLKCGEDGLSSQGINAQAQSNFPNIDAPQQPFSDHNPIKDSKSRTHNSDQLVSSYAFPTSNTLPQLVSASPECSSANTINPNDIISNPSNATSTTFEAWRNLMDDGANDNYWIDIIE